MQIPKRGSPQKYPRSCQYEGCSNAFYGYKIQKYCQIHQDSSFFLKRRMQSRRWKENKAIAEADNLHIKYSGIDTITQTVICPTCGGAYEITLQKNVKVYAGHCPKHINKYRRELFNKIKNPAGVCGVKKQEE